MTEAQDTPGQRVRFTAKALVTAKDPECEHFTADLAMEGDIGEMVGPHPTLALTGWLVAKWESPAGARFVPVKGSHFEAVA